MRASEPTVLVIEDEPSMRRVLRASLVADGYRFVDAATGRQGLEEAVRHKPDLVVLDLGLPDVDGMTVLRRLRDWSRTPVVVLSVRDREQDKVNALDGGADDYLTKPFSTGELLARLRAALRHAPRGGEAEPSIAVGELRIDLARQHAFVRDRRVHLTPTEYMLFAVLMKNAGKVQTHRQLLRDVWGADHIERVESLRVHIAALRKKLERDPARPKYLLAEPGVGYRLRVAR